MYHILTATHFPTPEGWNAANKFKSITQFRHLSWFDRRENYKMAI